MDEEEVFQLLWKLRDAKTGLSIKDRKKTGKTYKNCFVGSELVDWLLNNRIVLSRPEAVKFAEFLHSRNLFCSVKSKAAKNIFKDNADSFFRFVEIQSSSSDNAISSEGPISSPNSQEDMNKTTYRICVIGAEQTGKTALCKYFTKEKFSEKYRATITEKYHRKENYSFQSTMLSSTIEILDTGGNTTLIGEEFETKLSKWNQWANGFMLVYSCNSKASFDLIPKLFTSLIKIRQFRITPVILVASKADLELEKKVSKEDGQSLANRYRCKFIEISSLTGENIMDAFKCMLESINRVHFVTNSGTRHMSGWMKMRFQGKTKKQYIVMTDSGLRYYRQEPESANDTSNLKGIIPMLNCQVEIIRIGHDGSAHFGFGMRRNSDPDIKRIKSTTIVPERRFSDTSEPNKDDSNIYSNAKEPSMHQQQQLSESDTETSNYSATEDDVDFQRLSIGNSTSSSFIISKGMSKQSSLGSLSKQRLHVFISDSNDNEYALVCQSEEERDQWYEDICRAIAKTNALPDKNKTSQTATVIDGVSHSKQAQTSEVSPNGSILTYEELCAQTIPIFNKNPKKGIQFFLSNYKFEDTKSSTEDPRNSALLVAKFIWNNHKLLKRRMVGEYLGDVDTFSGEVLKSYLHEFDFTNVPFDDALRMFLSRFTIPGEAQKIDRIMEKFAGRFCECNPKAFETPDVGYILAFSLIMLNTDAHNASIKPENKMTKQQFVHNNRGINNGKDLAKEYLEELYDNIVQKEIAMEHERDDFSQWDKQGWIYIREMKSRQSSMNKKNYGKKRWCIISACCLYVFETPQEKKPLHIIPLGNLQIDSLFEEEKKTEDELTGFILYHPEPRECIRSAVEGKEVHLKELVFFFENRKQKVEWMLTFKLNLISAPSYKT